MGLFTCCVSDRKQSKTDAEARHARIIDIYSQAEAEAESRSLVPLPPPSYHEIVYDTLSGTTIFVDDKSTTQAQVDLQPRTSISRPPSPQTSIYSVPSTRLTDITSAHTGGTIVVTRPHQGDSPRSSLVFDSAPPSYYDGRSMRERSRSPHNDRQPDEQQHPVMDDQWLEVLRRAAESQERRIRDAQNSHTTT